VLTAIVHFQTSERQASIVDFDDTSRRSMRSSDDRAASWKEAISFNNLDIAMEAHGVATPFETRNEN
jgi:hypothetical protein